MTLYVSAFAQKRLGASYICVKDTGNTRREWVFGVQDLRCFYAGMYTVTRVWRPGFGRNKMVDRAAPVATRWYAERIGIEIDPTSLLGPPFIHHFAPSITGADRLQPPETAT